MSEKTIEALKLAIKWLRKDGRPVRNEVADELVPLLYISPREAELQARVKLLEGLLHDAYPRVGPELAIAILEALRGETSEEVR